MTRHQKPLTSCVYHNPHARLLEALGLHADLAVSTYRKRATIEYQFILTAHLIDIQHSQLVIAGTCRHPGHSFFLLTTVKR